MKPPFKMREKKPKGESIHVMSSSNSSLLFGTFQKKEKKDATNYKKQ